MQGNAMNFGPALIDIDHFKQINDRYGHLVGDAAIQQITEIIKQNIFSRDVLCRYGGEEFAVLLTKTAPGGLYQAVEKIRREIDEHEFILEPGSPPHHITVSIGLVNFEEVQEHQSVEILKLADDRLYRAKRLGRNRIIHANGEST
jgi:diguanylate cyclase (GGDEF)-like protein